LEKKKKLQTFLLVDWPDIKHVWESTEDICKVGYNVW